MIEQRNGMLTNRVSIKESIRNVSAALRLMKTGDEHCSGDQVVLR
jgi:hypothetical protein